MLPRENLRHMRGRSVRLTSLRVWLGLGEGVTEVLAGLIHVLDPLLVIAPQGPLGDVVVVQQVVVIVVIEQVALLQHVHLVSHVLDLRMLLPVPLEPLEAFGHPGLTIGNHQGYWKH
eukprot:1249390-Pyramimonas_sp.AAC.1